MTNEKLQGGAMGGVEELYREVILDHFRTPKNKGKIESANAQADGVNPLCGDQLSITGKVNGNKVEDVRFEGHGCAISQSAASMLTELMKGKTLDEIKLLAQTYKNMFGVHEKSETPQKQFTTDDLGDLISLEGVKKYPVRIKCALLSVNTLIESLKKFL
jgi:nitrogen fixation NifU-like protein